jgi:hypothetical protein
MNIREALISENRSGWSSAWSGLEERNFILSPGVVDWWIDFSGKSGLLWLLFPGDCSEKEGLVPALLRDGDRFLKGKVSLDAEKTKEVLFMKGRLDDGSM